MKIKNIGTTAIKVLFIVVVALFSLVAYSCSTDCGEDFPAPMPDSTAASKG